MTEARRGPDDVAAGGALDKVLTVLEVVVDGGARTSLGEVAQRAALRKPTTHRILAGLVTRGYVASDGDGVYRPGPQILALAGHVLAKLDYPALAHDALLDLQRAVPETIHLAILSGRDLRYVDKLEGLRAYRMASVVGMRLPLHCTAIGKALLANLPPATRSALLDGETLPRRTDRTITDHRALREELDRVAAQGYAIDDEENEDGVRCVAAPVFGMQGHAIGGVSVSAPAFHLTLDEAHRVSPAVRTAAIEISRSLGAPSASRLLSHPAGGTPA